MIHLAEARELMERYLRRVEGDMDLFGSALPENRDRPKHRLVVTQELEYEFGWVFCYDTKEFVERGDPHDAVAGNAPVIIDRSGKMYVTGTARPLEHYVKEYRRGKRTNA